MVLSGWLSEGEVLIMVISERIKKSGANAIGEGGFYIFVWRKWKVETRVMMF